MSGEKSFWSILSNCDSIGLWHSQSGETVEKQGQQLQLDLLILFQVRGQFVSKTPFIRE